MKRHSEDPLEEMARPARVFIFGLLLMGCLSFLPGSLPTSVEPVQLPARALPSMPLTRLPKASRVRIHLELARAERRAESEFLTFFRTHPDQKYLAVLAHLKDKYRQEVGSRYHLSALELEQVWQEGRSESWLKAWPAAQKSRQ